MDNNGHGSFWLLAAETDPHGLYLDSLQQSFTEQRKNLALLKHLAHIPKYLLHHMYWLPLVGAEGYLDTLVVH